MDAPQNPPAYSMKQEEALPYPATVSPQGGGFPPYPQAGYPPQPGGFSPQKGGFPPQPGGFPQQPVGCPPQPGGFPPRPVGLPPQPVGFPPQPGGFPPQPGGFPPQEGFFVPPQAGYPPGGFPPGDLPPGQQQPLPEGFPPTDNLRIDAEPGAPPLSELEDLPGYEGLTFDAATLKPPAYDECTGTAALPAEIFQNAPSLSEEEARDALIQYVAKHCCYGSKAAKQMVITNITFKSAIHYKLETFGEKRETAWVFEPYKDQQNIVRVGGYAPGPWELDVPNEQGNFKDLVKAVEVPNTTNIRPCHKCGAMGRVYCSHCHGRGRKSCNWCHGRGRRTMGGKTEACHSCGGGGYSRCLQCRGFGHVTCSICKGHCQLRYFVQLTVTWKNHIDDHISHSEDVPNEQIRQVSGDVAFMDEQPRVCPVSGFPDEEVNNASHNLVTQHRSAFPDERILMQRQQVRIVPVAEVSYSWKRKEAKFHVYGFEHEVYFPDYPQSCCWGCQII